MGVGAAIASVGTFLASTAASAGAALGIGGAAAAGAAGAGALTTAVGTAALPSLAFATEAAATAPAWLSTIGTASSLLSGVVGGIGQIEQGQAAASASRYNAAIAANNAAVARANASIAGQAGEQQAYMTGEKTRALVGSIKANQAASGIDVQSGSAVDVRSSASELGELDALTVRSNATREAYGYSQQAAGFQQESTLDTFAAKNQAQAGIIGGATTFLGGVGDAATKYYQYQLSGGSMFG